MISRVEVHPGRYHDSVRLMQASKALQEVSGVEEALVAMATDLNLSLLADMGFDPAATAGRPERSEPQPTATMPTSHCCRYPENTPSSKRWRRSTPTATS